VPAYSGTNIFDILTKTQLTNATHQFTTTTGGNVPLGDAEVQNFYGDVNITTGTSQATINSTYFSDVTAAQDDIMCVRIFHGNLTIGSGVTFTPPHRTKGLFVFVKGNLTNNGTISMTGKGASGTPANVYLWGSAFVPAGGQTGAEGVSTGSGGGNLSVAGGSPDVQGKPKTARATGGGGSASVRRVGSNTVNVVSAAGSAGTSWSGGFGSGGISTFASSGTRTGNAPTLTTGGAATVHSTTSQASTIFIGGGSGVFGGDGLSRAGTTSLAQPDPPYAAEDGTAGLLMIACLGIYTNNGTVSSVGTSGGTGSADHANGGASGGGSINIVASSIGGTGGTTTVAGGTGTTAGFDSVNIGNNTGGSGGAGSYTAQTFAQESIQSLPRRTLFKTPDNKLWYRNFSGSGSWQEATGTGTEPFQSFGMFDAEVYALTSTQILAITGINASAIKIQTYVP
jgi:hypothetical protein